MSGLSTRCHVPFLIQFVWVTLLSRTDQCDSFVARVNSHVNSQSKHSYLIHNGLIERGVDVRLSLENDAYFLLAKLLLVRNV